MGRPGAIVIQYEVIIEQIGYSVDRLFKPVPFFIGHQAGQIHDFIFFAETVHPGIDTAVNQRCPHRFRVTLALTVEHLAEAIADFDHIIAAGWVIAPQDLLPHDLKFGIGADQIFEDIGHIPVEAQTHFRRIFEVLQLFRKRGVLAF